MDSREKSFYDRVAPFYDLMGKLSEDPSRKAGLDLLDVREGASVLELGCGTGHSLVDMAHRAGMDGYVCGLDLSPEMIRICRRRMARKGLSRQVSLYEGDARNLSWDEGTFGGVFACFTIELFSDEDILKVFSENFRVLKKGGCLVVVHMSDRKSNAIVRLYERWHRKYPRFIDCHPVSLVYAMEKTGFVPEIVKEKSLWGLPVDIIYAVKPQS